MAEETKSAGAAGAKEGGGDVVFASGVAREGDDVQVVVDEWRPVVVRRSRITFEKCSICLTMLSEGCTDCLVSGDPDECNVAFGFCSHAFHRHCVEKWLKKQGDCPLCGQDWEYHHVGDHTGGEGADDDA